MRHWVPNTRLRTMALALGLAALAAGLLACAGVVPADSGRAPDAATTTSSETDAAPQSDDTERPAGWREESHSNDADLNYDVVFPIDTVNTITITFAPDDWAAMQTDMEEINASMVPIRNAILAAGPGLSREERVELLVQLLSARAAEHAASASPVTATVSLTATEALTSGALLTGAVAAPAGSAEDVSNRSPMWVPATITFQGQEWTHVGVRYKGVSSLGGPWVIGELRLPFKFDFDQFEDDYPEIDNQRFFGFKQLTLANNHEDASGIRDTVVYDLLEEAGVPSLQTAPYEVVLDYGEGPVRLGLYTVIEVIDDTGVPSYFGSDDGNIYEGDGPGASLAIQDMEQVEDSFQKKNNEDKEDWSDIWALYDLLHAENRTSDPEVWHADLEAIFDVDSFLEWLGIAAAVGHADTYGSGAHNFYLYNNPETGQLTWYSWDHNFTFVDRFRSSVTFDRANVTDSWPLIRYLLDDAVFWDRYVEILAENSATVLAPEAMVAKIRAHAEVIAPFATLEMSQEEYDAAVQELVDFVEASSADMEAFLAEQK